MKSVNRPAKDTNQGLSVHDGCLGKEYKGSMKTGRRVGVF